MIWLDMKNVKCAVMINPDLIVNVQSVQNGSIITLKNETTYTVKQSKKQVKKLIKESK